jgi:hypothetical protein
VQARQGDRQRRECVEISSNDEQKVTSLMLREHLINLVEAMTEKEISESLQRTEPEQKLR